ncbi:MAG: hypothetical protein KDC46_10330 [Thermoleophilia bacterium]|nr:hypothetical protein [Thermoleophilia bacterium]
MAEAPEQPRDEQPDERRDAAARSGHLDRMARDAEDATFGESESSRVRVPGVLSGDLGPKGKVSAQMRDMSRSERDRYGEVPPGTVASRGGLLVLLPMLAIALGLIALVVLLGWLLA